MKGLKWLVEGRKGEGTLAGQGNMLVNEDETKQKKKKNKEAEVGIGGVGGVGGTRKAEKGE